MTDKIRNKIFEVNDSFRNRKRRWKGYYVINLEKSGCSQYPWIIEKSGCRNRKPVLGKFKDLKDVEKYLKYLILVNQGKYS